MRLRDCETRFWIALAHAARFTALCAVVFAGLVLIAGVEYGLLSLGGIEYTPRQNVWRTSLRQFSPSADGRSGVTFQRVFRKASGSAFESDIVIHDFVQHRSMRLALSHLKPSHVAMAPVGDALAVATADGSIYMCSFSFEPALGGSQCACTSQLLLRSPNPLVSEPVFSPNGQYLVAAGYQSISLLNLADRALVRSWPVDNTNRGLVISFSQDSSHVLTHTGGVSARLWSTSTGEQLATVPLHGEYVMGGALSSDARFATFIDCKQGVQVWSFQDSESVRCESWLTYSSHGLPNFSLDGRLVATVGNDRQSIELYNAATGECVRQFRGHMCSIAGMSFGSAHWLYSWEFDGTIRAWNIEEQNDDVHIAAHASGVGTLHMDPLLAVGS